MRGQKCEAVTESQGQVRPMGQWGRRGRKNTENGERYRAKQRDRARSPDPAKVQRNWGFVGGEGWPRIGHREEMAAPPSVLPG